MELQRKVTWHLLPLGWMGDQGVMFSGVFYAFRIATFAWSSILTYNFQESHKNLSHNMFSQVF